jgi:hypothetical protein
MKEDGRCFNCGVENAATRDHDFSRALFPQPKPSNLMTVPSFLECQALYQPDEGYFRDLTAVPAGPQHSLTCTGRGCKRCGSAC